MKTIITSELSPGRTNEIINYINQLYVVGRNWMPGCKCTYIYRLRSRDDEEVRKHLKAGTIKQFVKMKAGDFQDIEDFRLEFYDEVIHFTNEESWELFDEEELFA